MPYPRILMIIICFGILQVPVRSQLSDIVFIDFETSSPVMIDIDSSNIWQTGKPDKSLFTNSRSGMRAIMTDTINPYPTNNHSTFHFTVYKPQYDQQCALWFTFWHYFDMDTINDYGYVDFSYNGGTDWHTGTDWDLNFEEFFFERYFEDQKIGGDFDPIITGKSHGWVRDQYIMQWYNGVKKGTSDAIYPDSIMIRFNFVSDSVQNSRDGWMIDDIRVERLVCGGVTDYKNDLFTIFPNPTNGLITLQAYNSGPLMVTLLGINGQELLTIEVNDPMCQLDLSSYQRGIYFITVRSQDFVITQKIVNL